MGKLKHEIRGKLGAVAFDCLIQNLGCNTVNPRQISIQHHSLASQFADQSVQETSLDYMWKNFPINRKTRQFYLCSAVGEDCADFACQGIQ